MNPISASERWPARQPMHRVQTPFAAAPNLNTPPAKPLKKTPDDVRWAGTFSSDNPPHRTVFWRMLFDMKTVFEAMARNHNAAHRQKARQAFVELLQLEIRYQPYLTQNTAQAREFQDHHKHAMAVLREHIQNPAVMDRRMATEVMDDLLDSGLFRHVNPDLLHQIGAAS